MNLTMISDEKVANIIYSIRGQRVMLDVDLAKLYGVTPKRLNEQVKRNSRRFPKDFMFQLTADEQRSLRSQNATLDKKRGKGQYRKYLPYAFTEQGVAMLSGVLNSRRAIDVNVAIMRVFVKLKQILTSNKELAFKLSELERKIESHDGEIQAIFSAIRQLMNPPKTSRRKIGFHP